MMKERWGGDLGAGKQQIKCRRYQCTERRPFLYRVAVRECRDQSKRSADKKEHNPGHHRHVITGNRQHVGEA